MDRPGPSAALPAAELGSGSTAWRALGPPWRQDEKLATLAAWVSLAALKRRRTR